MPLNGAVASDWQRLSSDIPVRSAVRFPMQLAIQLFTDRGTLEATTVDVSANGVLFTGDWLPALNSRVEFMMTMPGTIMGSRHDVSIHCVGRIVRHQKRITDEMAAAVIDEYFLKA